jgi:hypothetical protein
MSTHREASNSEACQKLKAWLARWPTVRGELEALLAEQGIQDPALHFELALARVELQDIDENVKRIKGMSSILFGGDLTSAELEATGN